MDKPVLAVLRGALKVEDFRQLHELGFEYVLCDQIDSIKSIDTTPLRDKFAMAALQNVGWIDAREARPGIVDSERPPAIARLAFSIADAMLAEREKKSVEP
jgi:hypothetical protein